VPEVISPGQGPGPAKSPPAPTASAGCPAPRAPSTPRWRRPGR